jgi:hypothetical protein
MYAHVYVCISSVEIRFVCIKRFRMCTCVCMYVCVCVCARACACACAHLCMYVIRRCLHVSRASPPKVASKDIFVLVYKLVVDDTYIKMYSAWTFM